MNIFKRLEYFFMSIKERHLTLKLGKKFKTRFQNKTSKTIMSATETMTLTSETEKNKALVDRTVNEVMKACANKPEMLLEYIKSKGTPVKKIKHADFWLSLIGEDIGLVCELNGLKALCLNLLTGSKPAFKSVPMFILIDGVIDPYIMLHQFHKWCSYKNNLPGFDQTAQKNFKKSLKSKNFKETNNLSLEEIISLKEAVARDQEATAFVLKAMKNKDGSQKAFGKMTSEGSANV